MRTTIWYCCGECDEEFQVKVNVETEELSVEKCPTCGEAVDEKLALEDAAEQLQDEQEAAAEDAADAKRNEEGR